MSDDAIEMRIRSWFNMPPRPPEPDVMFVRVADRETWMLVAGLNLYARVDGGDPGDEDQAPWFDEEDDE